MYNALQSGDKISRAFLFCCIAMLNGEGVMMGIYIIKCNDVVEYVYHGNHKDAENKMKSLELDLYNEYKKEHLHPMELHEFGEMYEWQFYEIKNHNIERGL